MRSYSCLRWALVLWAVTHQCPLLAQPALEVLTDPTQDWSQPEGRQKGAERLRTAEEQQRARTEAKATSLGLPLRRMLARGRVSQIHDFSEEHPRYRTTFNVTAAITAGTAPLQSAPFSLLGSNVTVGVWDAGGARAAHQEFSGRLSVRDGASADDHATHVSGTIAASGVDLNARGMAPAASVASYDWDFADSEMIAAAATASNQSTKIYLSNHSYGLVTGWTLVEGGFPYRDWEWSGGTSTTADPAYGRYNADAAEVDSITANAPYFLPFWAAGNDRTDNPTAGDTIALTPNATSVANYNAAIHPAGDGVYRNGYDTIAGWGVAKNAVTIGSVADAVTAGSRDVSKAIVDDFSCWGPTDDGRIKPDLVANGNEVYSATATSNTSYDQYSGTSMASPSACGSAALLVQHYRNLFAGQAMRASSLKGLLIHTASDLGNPGPDYQSGWGLIHTQAAAELLSDHAAAPFKKRLTESSLTSTTTTRTHAFHWDGVSPIRATLCWTDPAATTTTQADQRLTRLVRDLDLKIIAPSGAEFFPFVMPFTSSWSNNALSATATTGTNRVDTVEQVRINTPTEAGIYQVVVSTASALPTPQVYSLLISGSADSALPATAQSATPSHHTVGQSSTVTVTGSGFNPFTQVSFVRSGATPVTASSITLLSDTTLTATFDLTAVNPGIWDLKVQNGSTPAATIPAAITLMSSLLAENFDSQPASGWASEIVDGTSSLTWTPSTALSHTTSTSYFAAGTITRSSVALVSPLIPLPTDPVQLRLSFWHLADFVDGNDGGILEYQLEDETGPLGWQDALTEGNGTTVVAGAYNAFIPANTNTFYLGGKSAWSGRGTGFINTVIDLTDLTRFAGKSIRFRWVIGTSRSTNSVGWYVDSVTFGALDASQMVAPNSLVAWRSRHFSATEITAGLAASTADPDGDGLANLAEYALGLDPRSPGAMPYTLTAGSSPVLQVSRPSQLPDVTWLPQVSADLIDWSPALLQVQSSDNQEIIEIMPPESFPTSGKTFLRIGFQERAP